MLPRIIATRRLPTLAASVRQERMRVPSTWTVHAPHCPWSQPFFVPVRPMRSRSASSYVVRESIFTLRWTPLISSDRSSSRRAVFWNEPGLGLLRRVSLRSATNTEVGSADALRDAGSATGKLYNFKDEITDCKLKSALKSSPLCSVFWRFFAPSVHIDFVC